MNFQDNLFSANHRNMMLSRYGYTEALRVTVGDLIPKVSVWGEEWTEPELEAFAAYMNREKQSL